MLHVHYSLFVNNTSEDSDTVEQFISDPKIVVNLRTLRTKYFVL